ncbi:MAG: FkbM family methyltransferase [Pseudomonadota bacterium]
MPPSAPPIPPGLVHALARLTRRFHPKGTDRLLRAIHPPGNARPIRTVVDYDDGLLLNIDTQSFCEWYIFFYGVFRPEVSKLLNRMLRPGHVAFDIGANIGMHSVVMANRVGTSGKVVCFEPDPHPLARLKRNLALNGFDFVDTHQIALSANSERRRFYSHDEGIGNFANASLYAENVGRPTPSVEIEVVSLDDFIAGHPVPRLDVVKLLAQGEEWNILEGGRETLARFRPKVFFLYEPAYWRRVNRTLADAVKFFAAIGYTTSAVEFGPRREVSAEIDKGQVLLATP